MAVEVFNRYEKKYLMEEAQYLELSRRIQDYMIPDAYNREQAFYEICNIYYDTADDRLIRASIEKPVYKEKLRLRSYGQPEPDSKVFVEIKKKYNGIVNKRRTAMRLSGAYDYLNKNIRPEDLEDICINKQVLREIDYFRQFYRLIPKVCLSYERRAYFERDDGDFRVTFDRNITARRSDLKLESGSYGDKLLPPDVYLMEIKINRAVPLWFTKILSELEIYPVSFSKYGTEYKKYLLNNQEGEQQCLNQFLQEQQQRIPSILAHPC